MSLSNCPHLSKRIMNVKHNTPNCNEWLYALDINIVLPKTTEQHVMQGIRKKKKKGVAGTPRISECIRISQGCGLSEKNSKC